ncbi:MAG: acyl carrier protein [Gammaproteobacteria bacterium]|nr:acyl carrier protein [Gammaproteobacteria bacterium]
MTMQTFEKIQQILVERFAIDAANVRLGTDLEKDLKLDSMDAMDLLLAINETFKINIPEQTLEKVHTIGELVDVVEKHVV